MDGKEQFAANEAAQRQILALNAMASRWFNFFNSIDQGNGRRDLNKECDYPETASLDAHAYKAQHIRNPIARRVDEVLPKETWKSHPEIFEDPNEDVSTPFEEAVKELPKNLRGKSWFKDNVGNPIWEALAQLDEKCGIGTFGILLYGFDDGLELNQPVKGVIEKNSNPAGFTIEGEEKKPIEANPALNGSYSLTVNLDETKKKDGKGLGLIYLRVFDESQVQVTQYETNFSSPRYNQPVMYLIQLNDPETNSSGYGMPNTSIYVHWTRVLHVPSDSISGVPWFGSPRQQPVYNRLLDIEKVSATSGEGYFRGAILQIFMTTHPSLGGDVNIDQAKLKDDMENMQEGMQKWMSLMGMMPVTVPPAAIDPTPWIDCYINIICITLGIPKRKFMGSERGELSSSEDEGDWNDTIRARQDNITTPRIIIPFFDRLIMVGVLPEPKTPPKPKEKPKPTVRGSLPAKPAAEDVPSPQGEQKPKPPPQFSRNKANGNGFPPPKKAAEPTAIPGKELGEEKKVTKSDLGYSIKWQDLDALSAQEKADVALVETQAMGMYVQQGVEALIDPKDYLITVLGKTEEEAQSIIDNVMEHLLDAYPETDENATPGHIPAPPTPELPPSGPIKMSDGETLVDADKGKKIFATPKPKIPAGK